MVSTIGREDVQELVRTEHAQVVEVLPREEYEWAHLPGATHLHLRELNQETADRLARERPVIAYCSDLQCDMSPRAARRLERLGVPRVYDYAAGKLDWLSYGLPHEGSALLAGDVMHKDVPTCGVNDLVDTVSATMMGRAWDLCVVVDGELAEARALEPAGDRTVSEVMVFGPATVRPSDEVEALLERMNEGNVDAILVTRSDGRCSAYCSEPKPKRFCGNGNDGARIHHRRSPGYGASPGGRHRLGSVTGQGRNGPLCAGG